MIKFDIIVACCNKNGIGKGGELPWKLRKEMAHFRKITMDAPEGYRNVVIMGRNTWESIPDKFKPLPGRHNIILTSKTRYLNDSKYDKVRTYRTLNNALEVVARTQKMFKYNKVFVIGGEQLYKEAVPHICCEQILLTKVYKKLDCDRFFPKITAVETIKKPLDCLISDPKYVSEQECLFLTPGMLYWGYKSPAEALSSDTAYHEREGFAWTK